MRQRRGHKTQRCSVAGCDLLTQARGFCRRHYQRWRDGKDVNAPFATDRKQCVDCAAPFDYLRRHKQKIRMVLCG